MSSPSTIRAPRARRRQRSTRLTVAATLVAVSALVVVSAVLSGSWLLVTFAAFLSVLLGAAATRITHSELALTRVEAARDRAEQAQAYRDLTAERAAENAAFAADMSARIASRESTIGELEVALEVAHQRVADATRKMGAEARRAEQAEQEGRSLASSLDAAEERAAEAIVAVAELEQEIDVLRAELMIWQSTPARRHA